MYREDIDIYDTMQAIVKYSNGATMSYSLNTLMPFEGYRVAFNGELGRLEVRDYERQPWEVPGEETEIHVTKSFGLRARKVPASGEGGHGGGDDFCAIRSSEDGRARSHEECPAPARARCRASPASRRGRASKRSGRSKSPTW